MGGRCGVLHVNLDSAVDRGRAKSQDEGNAQWQSTLSGCDFSGLVAALRDLLHVVNASHDFPLPHAHVAALHRLCSHVWLSTRQNVANHGIIASNATHSDGKEALQSKNDEWRPSDLLGVRLVARSAPTGALEWTRQNEGSSRHYRRPQTRYDDDDGMHSLLCFDTLDVVHLTRHLQRPTTPPWYLHVHTHLERT